MLSPSAWPVMAGLSVAAAALLTPGRAADRLRGLRAARPAGRSDRPGRWGRLGGPSRRDQVRGRWRRGRPDLALGTADLALLAEQLAALARAGLPPRRIWPVLAERAVSSSTRALAAAVTSGHRGGESTGEAIRRWQLDRASPALRLTHRRPDPAVIRLAVAIDVSERTGAGLAETLQRFAEGLRADLHAEQERATALAGPRGTAQILSWLPLAGLMLGGLVGAHPWRTLLATGAGRACLLAGAVTWAAGRGWSAALVRTAGPA